jgi:hypothetical protein
VTPRGHSPEQFEELRARYQAATSELMAAHGALAQCLQAELEARLRTWVAHPASTVAERERVADHAAMPFTSEKFGLKGHLAALEAEITYLRDVLGYS